MKKNLFKIMGLGILGLFSVGFIGMSTSNQVNAQGVGVLVADSFGETASTAGIKVSGTGKVADGSLLNIVKSFINWTLGILGLIALVILLRGGFQMVTAAGDEEKYKAGFKILKQAGVGLAFIGMAFFMVSIVLWLVGKLTGDTAGVGDTNSYGGAAQ